MTTIKVSDELVQKVVKAMNWNSELPTNYAVDQALRELLKLLEEKVKA